MLAVWSFPEVNNSGRPPQVKLGGTGLGLAALSSIEKIVPGFTSPDELRALGRSICFMQKGNGSFYSKFIPFRGGLCDHWSSLYYPGEAALGLLMLYEKDPSAPWLESAYRALVYLARSREHADSVPADHWALLATAKILSLEQNDRISLSEDLLINHAVRICEKILNEQIIIHVRPGYAGGFDEDGKTTHAATRLEGLTAVLSFLPPEHALTKTVISSIDRGMSFLLRAQITEEPFYGGIPRALAMMPGSSRHADKFNRRAGEIRIDYVQHALSAMIQYLCVMKNR
jgi:hypothetical protein